ncbi:MAG TPA: hypothetical protein VI732_05825 [Alphaproteobacteria bacterium]|nr:hypothetical protein [Alphaproteobacteria bacterium]
MRRNTAFLRTVASCVIAVSLIAEWPLALALSSQHLGRSVRLLDDLSASICLSGKNAAPAVPGKPAGAPAKTSPCPICQGLQAAKAPLPAGPADIRPCAEFVRVAAPEPPLLVAGSWTQSKHPRGPPLA